MPGEFQGGLYENASFSGSQGGINSEEWFAVAGGSIKNPDQRTRRLAAGFAENLSENDRRLQSGEL